MPTIAQLAPTLVAAGLPVKDIKVALRPHNAPTPPPVPAVQLKRYNRAMRLIAKSPTLTDAEVASLVTTITPAMVATIRAEVVAVQAKLAALDPVEDGVDPDTGAIAATFESSNNRVVKNKHGLDDGNRVRLHIIAGASGLTDGGEYFVVNSNANNFKLALTEGGSVIPMGSDGAGEYTVLQ